MNYRMIYKDELYHHGVKGMRWGVRKEKTNNSAQNNKQNAARIKKGAKFAGKVLVGAAATYAVVKLPNTKTFIKGSSKAAELLIKPIPGTKYLARQAALADKFDIAAGIATKAAAGGMVGTTAYKFNKKYKVSRRA